MILSIIKIYNGKKSKTDESSTPYSSETIKSVGKVLIDRYPDIDESQISNRHKKSNLSEKLKIIINNMISNGSLDLDKKQVETIKYIIAKRMHPFYQDGVKTKSQRTHEIMEMTMSEVFKKVDHFIRKKEKKGKGPEHKWEKSWSFGNEIADITASIEHR